jgi:hypothetical protein
MITGLALALAGTAMAGDVPDGRQARRMLFTGDATEVQYVEAAGLSETDRKIVHTLFGIDQFKALDVHYYASMAVSPGDGLQSAASNLAQNLHSPAAADAQALAACNKAKKAPQPCVVVARVLPRGWKPQPLSLNRDATEGIRDYLKGRGGKAMAISVSTPVWAVARGVGAGVAAMNECRRQASALDADDCELVIRDQ